MGANAVLGMWFDSSELANYANELWPTAPL
jgi:hypothetical protein